MLVEVDQGRPAVPHCGKDRAVRDGAGGIAIYRPSTARFLQADPIGYEGGVNLYGYVGNDPVNKLDPTGMYECKTDAACAVADRGIKEIRAARDFYASPAAGLHGRPGRLVRSTGF